MRYLTTYRPIDPSRYRQATQKVQQILGTPDQISSKIFARTGEHVGANNIRRWFKIMDVPLEVLIILQELTGKEVLVIDFLPWLEQDVH